MDFCPESGDLWGEESKNHPVQLQKRALEVMGRRFWQPWRKVREASGRIGGAWKGTRLESRVNTKEGHF